jgi:hypothetical protein
VNKYINKYTLNFDDQKINK